MSHKVHYKQTVIQDIKEMSWAIANFICINLYAILCQEIDNKVSGQVGVRISYSLIASYC